MSKFNWNRFYDELEEGDPKKFPYWMFFIHELFSLVEYFFAGLTLAMLLLIFTAGIFNYLLMHPENKILQKTFATAYCNGIE